MDALLKIIFEHLYEEPIGANGLDSFLQPKLKELAASVAALSHIYTRERQRVSERLLAERALRQAYLAYFLPCNLIKLTLILEELYAHPGIGKLIPRDLALLDLGCGPGTHLLGMLHFLKTHPGRVDSLACTGIDSVSANLQDARKLFEGFAREMQTSGVFPRTSLETRPGNLSQSLKLEGHSAFNFLVVGNVLNELFAEDANCLEKRFNLVAALVTRWLAPQGFLILIEPALKGTSRDLHALRDLLLERLNLQVYAPCVHRFPCPAVASGNTFDWCHEDRVWTPPAYLQKIDALVGNRKSSLKYSYAVLSRAPISIRETAGGSENPVPGKLQDPATPQIWRVVSERMEEKGKSSVFLCGDWGRIHVTRQNKHDSETNAAFSQLERGQVIETRGLAEKKPGDWRVEEKSLIKILIR